MYSSESRPTVEAGATKSREIVERADHFLVRHVLHGSHGGAEFQHFARAEEFHHLGGLGFAHRQHQDGGFLQSGILSHWRLSIP
jgi:hypothetical protein